MYKMHQGGKLLDNSLICNAYAKNGTKLPSLNVSASKGKDGAIYISICNLDPTVPAELKCTVDGRTVTKATGRVLTGETMNAHNTFDKPTVVAPADLKGMKSKKGKFWLPCRPNRFPCSGLNNFSRRTLKNKKQGFNRTLLFYLNNSDASGGFFLGLLDLFKDIRSAINHIRVIEYLPGLVFQANIHQFTIIPP
jgi:hypothetical protein